MARGFQAALEDALESGRVPGCKCWDHLRAAGLTPPADLVDKHTDVSGRYFDPSSGKFDSARTSEARKARSDAKKLMEQGRGETR